MNKYNVLLLDITSFISRAGVSDVVQSIEETVSAELRKEFPDVDASPSLCDHLANVVASTERKFIAIIDEWDSPIRDRKSSADAQYNYLEFLRSLFKNTTITDTVFAAAYMTGILPIKKDGSQSAISEFREYSMLEAYQFAPFVGFSEDEVKDVCDEYGVDFEKMKHWYDGYSLDGQRSIYNPYAVMLAAQNRAFRSYWQMSSAADSLLSYLNMDFDGLPKAITELLGGVAVKVNVRSFKNDLTSFRSRDDVLTLLIHFGYLSYDADAGTGYSWTNRLSFNKQGAENVSLKLLVGSGRQVILRVDGGHADGASSYTTSRQAGNFTFTGAGDAVTWEPFVSLSTQYVTVTGDAEGYVTITSTSTSSTDNANMNIYGITVVSAIPDDFASKTRTEDVVTYNKPVITLDATKDLAGAVSIDLTAEVATPTSSTVTYTAKVDGTSVKIGDAVSADLDDVPLSYAWARAGTAIPVTSLSCTATTSGTYTFTASYVAADKKKYIESKDCVVSDSTKAKHTVTFNSNGGSAVAAQEVEDGTKATAPTTPTRDNYTFDGWYTSDDEGVILSDTAYDFDTPVTANITLYAKWKEGSALVTYTEYFAKYKNDGDTDYSEVTAKTDTVFAYANNVASTVTFEQGVKLTGASDMKIVVKNQNFSYSGSVSYSATDRIQLGKGANGGKITVPVTANCTIRIGYNSNKNDNLRGVYATASSGTLIPIGSLVADSTKVTTASFTTEAAASAFYGDMAATNEIIEFSYVGNGGTVDLECYTDANKNAAGGACYISFVAVVEP